MKDYTNTARLRDILKSQRNQIVALKDIELDLIENGKSELAKEVSNQIAYLEISFAKQVECVRQSENTYPKKVSFVSSLWNKKPEVSYID
jgi:hypothetical protein